MNAKSLSRRECALRLEALRLFSAEDVECLLDVEAAEGATLAEQLTQRRAAQHPLVRRLADAEGRQSIEALERGLDAELAPGDWLLWRDGARYETPKDTQIDAEGAAWDDAEEMSRPLLQRFPVIHGNNCAARLNSKLCISVSGTRRPTDAGSAAARQLGAAAANGGVLLVHGGAQGIDEAAARGCADESGEQLVVLGGGLEHARGRHRLRALFPEVGVISFFAPFEPPQAHMLLARNWAIARLGAALVAAEVAGPEGGTFHAIKFAREAGRTIWTFARDPAEVACALESERLLRLAGARLLPFDWQDRLASIVSTDNRLARVNPSDRGTDSPDLFD